METVPTPTVSPPPTSSRHLFMRMRDRLEAAGAGDLLDYIITRREQTPPVPYRRLAIDLTNITGVDISEEAPRRWYQHYLRQIEATATETEAAPS